MAVTRLHIVVKPELKTQLEALAEGQRRTLSGLCNLILTDWVAAQPKPEVEPEEVN